MSESNGIVLTMCGDDLMTASIRIEFVKWYASSEKLMEVVLVIKWPETVSADTRNISQRTPTNGGDDSFGWGFQPTKLADVAFELVYDSALSYLGHSAPPTSELDTFHEIHYYVCDPVGAPTTPDFGNRDGGVFSNVSESICFG